MGTPEKGETVWVSEKAESRDIPLGWCGRPGKVLEPPAAGKVKVELIRNLASCKGGTCTGCPKDHTMVVGSEFVYRKKNGSMEEYEWEALLFVWKTYQGEDSWVGLAKAFTEHTTIYRDSDISRQVKTRQKNRSNAATTSGAGGAGPAAAAAQAPAGALGPVHTDDGGLPCTAGVACRPGAAPDAGGQAASGASAAAAGPVGAPVPAATGEHDDFVPAPPPVYEVEFQIMLPERVENVQEDRKFPEVTEESTEEVHEFCKALLKDVPAKPARPLRPQAPEPPRGKLPMKRPAAEEDDRGQDPAVFDLNALSDALTDAFVNGFASNYITNSVTLLAPPPDQRKGKLGSVKLLEGGLKDKCVLTALNNDEVEEWLSNLGAEEVARYQSDENPYFFVHPILAQEEPSMVVGGLLYRWDEPTKTIYLGHLFVSSSHQKRGLATALLSDTLREKHPECEHYEALSRSANWIGLRFFSTRGFSVAPGLPQKYGYDHVQFVGFSKRLDPLEQPH
mmetsp:Transcript_34572/g.87304  ORF Transcript_34572/g.87304 Transcript_34572/m.87304 type:complete len:507 (+) Transcript_34572:104-1624(+)